MTDEDSVRRAAEEFEDATERARLITTLVDLRLEYGLSQKEVGRRMGWKQSTVSAFEQGGQEGRDYGYSTIKRYARAIGVEVRMWIEPKKPELVEPPVGGTEGSVEEGTA